MTAHTARSAKVTMTRQFASYDLNANSLKAVSDEDICKRFPPPDWMQAKTRRQWCDYIRGYENGQFKRYNMPTLEQYIIVQANLNKLTRRIGYTSGLVKPQAEIDDEGAAVMHTRIGEELRLYRMLVLLLSRLGNDLHMPPRPYLVAGRGNIDDDSETEMDDERDTGKPSRLRLIGGRKSVKEVA